ncbi:MAG: response regulator [Nitrospirota bacterium]|nr:response regulator [Nitrospirota bacterium]
MPMNRSLDGSNVSPNTDEADLSQFSPGRPRLLLVDDNPQSLLALETILAGDDRDVVTAQSGEEALKRLLDDDYSVVLLDIKLTGIDGYETAGLIRARERTRGVPIIFLTSYNKDDADVVKGYAYGAVDYIFKPIVPEILASKVNVFVDLYKKTKDLEQKNEELVRAQDELIRTKAAETLIKHAPDPLFVTDLNANILLANNAACELLGLEPDSSGYDLSRFLPDDEVAQFTGALREVTNKGLSRNVELHLRSVRGKATPTTLNASAWRGADGKIIGAIGILRDMSEYKRVLGDLQRSKEELQEKIKDLEKFEEVVVGRELKMIALEKELKAFKSQPRTS